MLIQVLLSLAFGFVALAPANAGPLPVPRAAVVLPADVVLVQANEEDEEDEETRRERRRDRKGAEDRRQDEKGRREAEAERRKAKQEAAEQERQRREAEAAERQKAKQEAAEQERQRREAEAAEREKAKREAAEQERRRREAEAAEQQKEKEEAVEGERRQRETEAAERPRRERTGRERTRRQGAEETRAQERAKRRERERTPAKEIVNLRVQEGKAAVIDGGARTLRREGKRIVIRSDDTRRLRSDRDQQRVERLPNGQTRTTVIRPNGTRIITVTDSRGETIRRSRIGRDGREIVIFEAPRRPPLAQLNLGPLVINMPRDQYFYEYRRGAPRRDLERVMRAPPVERIDRAYSLHEIRSFERVRAIMPRIDFSEITFDTNSAYISPEQVDLLEDIAEIMLDMIDENPQTVFMIAGFTDATGSYEYNLVLSEQRAESVAIALTDYFDVLPENLVIQGYGPEFLKIDTPYAERANRRVEFINLTWLLAGRN